MKQIAFIGLLALVMAGCPYGCFVPLSTDTGECINPGCVVRTIRPNSDSETRWVQTTQACPPECPDDECKRAVRGFTPTGACGPGSCFACHLDEGTPLLQVGLATFEQECLPGLRDAVASERWLDGYEPLCGPVLYLAEVWPQAADEILGPALDRAGVRVYRVETVAGVTHVAVHFEGDTIVGWEQGSLDPEDQATYNALLGWLSGEQGSLAESGVAWTVPARGAS